MYSKKRCREDCLSRQLSLSGYLGPTTPGCLRHEPRNFECVSLILCEQTYDIPGYIRITAN